MPGIRLLVLYVLMIILFSLPTIGCQGEDDYYDEYYDDEIIVDPKNGSQYFFVKIVP